MPVLLDGAGLSMHPNRHPCVSAATFPLAVQQLGCSEGCDMSAIPITVSPVGYGNDIMPVVTLFLRGETAILTLLSDT